MGNTDIGLRTMKDEKQKKADLASHQHAVDKVKGDPRPPKEKEKKKKKVVPVPDAAAPAKKIRFKGRRLLRNGGAPLFVSDRPGA